MTCRLSNTKVLNNARREIYSNDQLIGTLLIEAGRPSIACWKREKISPFDDYEKVKDIIEHETKWRDKDGNYRKVLSV